MIAVSKNKRAVCTNTLSYRDLLHSDSPLVFHLSTFNNLYELELIQTQMAQKPMLRAEVGMRVRCANKASAE